MDIVRVGALTLALAYSVSSSAQATDAVVKPSADRAGEAAVRFVSRIQGVYFRYERLNESMGPYDAESTMEIVPYGRAAAYVRLRTAWGNYHSCSLYGIFKAEPDALIYERPAADGSGCRMRIALKDGTFKTSVQDLKTGQGQQTCIGGCGARGSFDGDDRFSLRLRRPIRYMQRLLASDEYEAAVVHHQGKIGSPDTALLLDLRRTQDSATVKGSAPQ